MIGNGVRIGTFDYGAQTTVNINDQKVFEGAAFTWGRRFSIPKNDSVVIVIDPTAAASNKVHVVLPIALSAFGAGPVNVDIYKGVDADDDGAVWGALNRDFRIIPNPETVVRFEPTINADGTLLPVNFFIPSNGISATAKAGGESRENEIFISDTTTKYMFRLSNLDTVDAALCYFSMTLFEVEEKG